MPTGGAGQTMHSTRSKPHPANRPHLPKECASDANRRECLPQRSEDWFFAVQPSDLRLSFVRFVISPPNGATKQTAHCLLFVCGRAIFRRRAQRTLGLHSKQNLPGRTHTHGQKRRHADYLFSSMHPRADRTWGGGLGDGGTWGISLLLISAL